MSLKHALWERHKVGGSLIWDNHGCMPLRADSTFLPQLQRYYDSGVNVLSLNIGMANLTAFEHLRVVSFFRRWISLRPERYRLVSTVQDIRRCQSEGKLGIVFDIEGMCPVQEDLSLVQTFYELGVRWMLVAYNQNNMAGGGCLDNDSGLTSVGRDIIDEMARVGMVLCLSHTGERTALEALEYSSNPVIFSHSNPHGDWPHKRNISDRLMIACARSGGVVGLSGIGLFLGTNDALVERLLRQLRYAIDLVGPNHVGLGLDYVFDRAELDDFVLNNPSMFPPGLDSSSGMNMIPPESIFAIVEGLGKDNLSDAHIGAILGGNWFRIAEQVWR